MNYSNNLRKSVIAGRSTHTVAARFIEQALQYVPNSAKAIAASQMAWTYEMSFDNALAIVQEMWPLDN